MQEKMVVEGWSYQVEVQACGIQGGTLMLIVPRSHIMWQFTFGKTSINHIEEMLLTWFLLFHWFRGLAYTLLYSLLSFVFTAHIHVTHRNKWIMFCGIICHDLFNHIHINGHLGYFQSLDINTKYLSTYVFVKCIWRVSFLRLSCWVSGHIPLKYQ